MYLQSLTGLILDGILIIGSIARQRTLARMMENGVTNGFRNFLDPRPEVHDVFAEYTRAMGAV